MRADVADAADAIRRGEAAVYPTETVYGLGADALSEPAVERVFELKDRPREKPLSLAVPDVDAALDYTRPTDREERFMRAFLPGPVTVVVERREAVPDALTAGRDRVGVRVPDHDLARSLLRAVEPTPITATSANRSGSPSVVRASDLDERIREGAGAVVDGGETPGTESTVVDPGERVIHRRGSLADDIEAWLADDGGR
ncbi:L-threonylcarbamoyladenylate synthase [Halegenticoccus tardaugens]|uniref:L-threonylcarbamoyladenylate synthase n=1 Tax=Halegenticoccus tardaugens TaxID=2071624 RepID=UPI00100A4517|nr:L-threonylcarbamoyladenylate synthase [Halegenticoccus tardaugens]